MTVIRAWGAILSGVRMRPTEQVGKRLVVKTQMASALSRSIKTSLMADILCVNKDGSLKMAEILFKAGNIEVNESSLVRCVLIRL